MPACKVRVKIVQHRDTKVYAAVKIIPRPRSFLDPEETPDTPVASEMDILALEREVAIMKLVSHPNLLALYDVWESKREM